MVVGGAGWFEQAAASSAIRARTGQRRRFRGSGTLIFKRRSINPRSTGGRNGRIDQFRHGQLGPQFELQHREPRRFGRPRRHPVSSTGTVVTRRNPPLWSSNGIWTRFFPKVGRTDDHRTIPLLQHRSQDLGSRGAGPVDQGDDRDRTGDSAFNRRVVEAFERARPSDRAGRLRRTRIR